MEHEIKRVMNMKKKMPIMMRQGFKPEVVVKAIGIGLIEIDADECLVWTESQTLLAYFCGKMWCGDSAFRNHRVRKYQWVQSDETLPTRGIKKVFKNARRLTDLRRNRKNLTPPEGFEVVDSLFVA